MDPISPKDTASVVASLRQLIIDGHYPAGGRLAEIPVSETLGVSRTPVRLAFRTLEQEGLLQKAGKRGFLVREFSETDVHAAIEVRGVLEGLAARHLADLGMPDAVRATLAECVDQGEQLLASGRLSESGIGPWGALNDRFHTTIVQATGSRVIADAIARNNHLPFASADSLAIDKSALDKEYRKLAIAQFHHRLIFDALDRRESARVEMLMREHAQVGLRYGTLLGLKAGPMSAQR
jgi:GntR family transcriptional regulator, vanillate catabolism transcriptional regulator